MHPVVCMITDRERTGESLIDRIAAAARAGVDLVQIRERNLEGRSLVDLARRAVRAVRGTNARVIVNDRLDVALAAGAHGVHLRGDSMPASRVRTIVPRGFLVGRSVHTREDAIAATEGGGLDYLIFGTVFHTPSKPGREAAGIAALADVVTMTPLPVLAVGGMSVGRFGEVARAGAIGFAGIAFFSNGPPMALDEMVGQARAEFTPSVVNG